jgi:hypothetical protein
MKNMKTIQIKKPNNLQQKIENLRRYQNRINPEKLKAILIHLKKLKKEWKK